MTQMTLKIKSIPDNGIENLMVWKKAMELVTQVYSAANTFPSQEKLGLTAQIKKASVSIPSSISEGRGRKNLYQFKYFLDVAHASLVDVETHLLIAVNLKYITSKRYQKLMPLCDEIGKMIHGLQASFKTKKKTKASADAELVS